MGTKNHGPACAGQCGKGREAFPMLLKANWYHQENGELALFI
jgi:hypothetical protein